MTLLEILKFPNKNLKEKAEKVIQINKEIKNLINNMIETMQKNKGIGLAATQINIKKKIIVINIDYKTQPMALINPEILYKNDYITEKEGCLSFPNIFVKVKRFKNITVKFTNIKNENVIIRTNNLLSVCIQHEIDHLNGITLYDKMSNLQKKILKI